MIGTTRPSGREAEVLAALGAGQSNAQIAGRLHISVRTVEGHVSSLLRKYGVTGRAELAALAGSGSDNAPPAPGTVSGVPVARTSFVGRVRERAEILGLLAEERLVTLVGPGGAGKTRLAWAVVAEAGTGFPFGGAYVDLVPARDESVPQAVAAALHVAEGPEQSLEAAITARLGRGRTLLVLDNCEHVIDGVAAFADTLLTLCPTVTILATSRERLAVPGEHTVPIGPLPLGSDAERLFRERAAAAGAERDADPAVVTDLCARLDGLPLAIELAAARSRALGGPGLAAGLGDYLRLLAGGRGSTVRHRSMRSVIGWSHDLLAADEQTLFRRLGVFAGGFDLPAVAAVTGIPSATAADLLGRLADKNLVALDRVDGRWRLLATIRAYAIERLHAEDEYEPARQRHRRWVWEVAGALRHRSDGDWERDFDAIADDLRAALYGAGPDAHPLMRLLGGLTFARRFFAEAQGHYLAAALLAADPAEALTDTRNAAAAGLRIAGRAQGYQHLIDFADRAGAEPVTRARALAHAVVLTHRFIAQPLRVSAEQTRVLLAEARDAAAPADPETAALLASAEAWAAAPGTDLHAPDPELARAAVAAARGVDDPILLHGALDALAAAESRAGRLRAAHRIAQQRLPLLARIPRHEPYATVEVMDAYLMASAHAVGAGDLHAAVDDAGEGEDDQRGAYPYLGTRRVLALALAGRFDEALRRADAAWDEWQRNGLPLMRWVAPQAYAAALVHGLRGDGRYETWKQRALEIAGEPSSSFVVAVAAYADARLALHRGPAAATVGELVSRAVADLPEPWYAAYARAAGAELAVAAGLPEAPEVLRGVARAGAENDFAAATLARAHGRLARDPATLLDAAGQFERIGARFERAATLLLVPDRADEGRAELTALEVKFEARGR
ncbi:ATP-binding protein [Actinoplanes sp. CA-142083]|uniref:ATP-binding protein n=1 Tax=Actinoplanes sp. CA-142083 TaxID=3239903 RepID=UPI003D8FB119